MAATWSVSIDPLNIAEKLVRVTMVRTDDADPGNPFVYTTEGQVDTASVPLATIRTRLVVQAVAAYQAYAARVTAGAGMVAGWEDALETALDAEEPL